MKPLPSILTVVLCAAALGAQETPKPDTEKRVSDLERKLEILSKELEQQKAGTALPEAGEGRHGFAPAASKVYGVKSGLSIGGYGEMVYENFAATLENGSYSPKANGLDFLRQILYVGYKFNDRIVFNTEIEFEHGKTSGEPATTTSNGNVTAVKAKDPGAVSVEFAYLDFLFSERFNVRAGMLLLPVGFVNELHEPPVFLGARRPFVEQQLIPSTWRENGVGIHGELPANLSYRLYLVNGMNAANFSKAGIRGGRQNGASALAESLAWTGRLDWSPRPGMLLGASFYHGNSQPADNLPSLTTRLFEVHAEFRHRGFQARLLTVRGSHNGDGLAALPTSAAARQLGTVQRGHYLEAGYDLLSASGSRQGLVPFLRAESIDPQAEAIAGVALDPALAQRVLTYGLVYKPIPQVSVKADFSRIRNDARTGRNQATLALGYYF